MQKAHLHLIKYALDKGLAIHVDDGDGEWQRDLDSYQAVKDAVEAVDISNIVICSKERNENGKFTRYGWALIVLGNDPEELVADYSTTDWMAGWEACYYKTAESVYGA